MSDPNVDKWSKKGDIYLWNYKDSKNYPGWNLHCSDNGYDCLLDLLDRMTKSKWSSGKTFTITKPNQDILSIVTRTPEVHLILQSSCQRKKLKQPIYHLLKKIMI